MKRDRLLRPAAVAAATLLAAGVVLTASPAQASAPGTLRYDAAVGQLQFAASLMSQNAVVTHLVGGRFQIEDQRQPMSMDGSAAALGCQQTTPSTVTCARFPR